MPLLTATGEASLPAVLESRILAELADGERLIWVGRPRPGRWLLPSFYWGCFGLAGVCGWLYLGAGMAVGFGNVTDLFQAFQVVSAHVEEDARVPLEFLLVWIPVVMSLQPILTCRSRRRIGYALTDRRAVIWEPVGSFGFGGVAARSYRPEDLRRHLSRIDREEGSGDLIFEEFTTRDSDGDTQVHRRGFKAIERVREVEELVRGTLLNRPDPG